MRVGFASLMEQLRGPRRALELVFIQLTAVYACFVGAWSAGLIGKDFIAFSLFVPILALLGLLSFNRAEGKELGRRWALVLLFLTLVLAVALRAVPYIGNDVPLGYDPGIYKYIFDSYQGSLPHIPEQGLDNFIRQGHPAGLPTFATALHVFGATSEQLLVPFFILFSALLVFPVYLLCRRYFNRQVAILAVALYALSYTQLQTFWYLYYKNVLAMGLMLFALYFMDGEGRARTRPLPLILLVVATGFMHRPTFLILALTWVAFVICHWRKPQVVRSNVAAMLVAAALLCLIYLPRFDVAVLDLFVSQLTEPTPGTFYSPSAYELFALTYLPFAFLGFVFFIRRFNPLCLWFLINGVIVLSQALFYHRLLITLDLSVIMLGAAGLYYAVVNARAYAHRLRLGVVVVLLLASAWGVGRQVAEMEPLLNEEQLAAAAWIAGHAEEEAYVLATSYDAPWVLGWSERKVIAPGMFDWNQHNRKEWMQFLRATDAGTATRFLDRYPGQIYIYNSGSKDSFLDLRKFDNPRFETVYADDAVIYRYLRE